MLRLRCVAQNYDWGLLGPHSAVASLYALASREPAKPDKPYAELWMGTHPSGPSVLIPSEAADGVEPQPLKAWLAAHPEALGDGVRDRWGGDLPFLFKVLSVAKALSIQAHPNKVLAERLHASQPQHYKDNNHKPEMALALTPFEVLCSFVSTEELKRSIETVPELRKVLGEKACDMVMSGRPSESDALREAFTVLMTSDKPAVEAALAELVPRLTEKTERTPKEDLLLRLERQYPGDVGVLSACFLNHLMLEPGTAVYLAANEPHAYLSGECIECMAASDNVVRAGLTPKFRDTETLCSMLTYKQGLPEILQGVVLDKYTSRYTPPFDEFEVDRITVPVGESYKLAASSGPSILLTFQGNGAATQEWAGAQSVSGLKKGDILLVPAGAILELSAVVEADGGGAAPPEDPLQLYRALVNSRALQ